MLALAPRGGGHNARHNNIQLNNIKCGTQHNDPQNRIITLMLMPSVIMLSVTIKCIVLIVITLSVIKLKAMVPWAAGQ